MPILSRYRLMWVLVMFDLPVLLPQERKEANGFRKFLQGLGFERCQLSVYLRCCSGKERVEFFARKIQSNLPLGGQVDILSFTDKQYENIISFRAHKKMVPKKVEQLTFF